MEWHSIVALGIAAPFVLFPVAFTWYVNGGGIYSTIKRRIRAKLTEKEFEGKTCAIDADCPEGYACVNGRCAPQV